MTRTLTEWARMLGCSRQAILGRIRMGWSAEDVVTVPVAGKQRRPIGPYASVYEASRALGISRGLIPGRLQRGWSDEAALSPPRTYRQPQRPSKRRPAPPPKLAPSPELAPPPKLTDREREELAIARATGLPLRDVREALAEGRTGAELMGIRRAG